MSELTLRRPRAFQRSISITSREDAALARIATARFGGEITISELIRTLINEEDARLPVPPPDATDR